MFAGSGLVMEVSVTLNSRGGCECSSLMSSGQPKDSSGQGGRRGGRGTHPWSHALEGVETGDAGTHHLQQHPHHEAWETPAMPAHPGSLCHNTSNETSRAFSLDLRRQVLSVN